MEYLAKIGKSPKYYLNILVKGYSLMVEQRSSTPYMWVQFLLPLFIFKTNIFVKKIFNKSSLLTQQYNPITTTKFNKKHLNPYLISILFSTKKYNEKLNSVVTNPSYTITQYYNSNPLNHYFSKKINKRYGFKNNLNLLKRYTYYYSTTPPTNNNNFRLNKITSWGTNKLIKKSSNILYKTYYFNKIRNYTRVNQKKTIIMYFFKKSNSILMTDSVGITSIKRIGNKYIKFFTKLNSKNSWLLSKTALFYLYNTKFNNSLWYINDTSSISGEGGGGSYYDYSLILTLGRNIKNTISNSDQYLNRTTKCIFNNNYYYNSAVKEGGSIKKRPYFNFTMPLFMGRGTTNKSMYSENLIYKYFLYFIFYYTQYNSLLKTQPIEFLTKKNYFNKYLSIFLGNSMISTTSSKYNFIKIFKKENNLQIFFSVFTKLISFKKLLFYNNVGFKNFKSNKNKDKPYLLGLLKKHLHIYKVVKYISKYKNIYKYLYLLKNTTKFNNTVGKGKIINTFKFCHVIITFLNIKKFFFKNNYKNKIIPITKKNSYNPNLVSKDLRNIRYMRIFKNKYKYNINRSHIVLYKKNSKYIKYWVKYLVVKSNFTKLIKKRKHYSNITKVLFKNNLYSKIIDFKIFYFKEDFKNYFFQKNLNFFKKLNNSDRIPYYKTQNIFIQTQLQTKKNLINRLYYSQSYKKLNTNASFMGYNLHLNCSDNLYILLFTLENPFIFKSLLYFSSGSFFLKKLLFISNINKGVIPLTKSYPTTTHTQHNNSIPKLSNFFTTNLIPSKTFSHVFFKKVFTSLLNSKMNLNLIPIYHNTLVRFMEHIFGHKIVLQFYPFVNQSLSITSLIKYKLWLPRLSFYEKKLGHKFFLEESIHIIHLGFVLKDATLILKWLKAIILRISFWRTRLIFRFLKYLMLNFFSKILMSLGIRGFKLKLKGKISAAGNSRKRLILYRVGQTSHSTLNLSILNEVDVITTFTGVMGISVSLFY